jgi:hypothetical protein
MTEKYLISERDGQALKATYFATENGAGVRFFINDEFILEEVYEGKSLHFAESAAQNWLAGIKTLNG